MEDYIIYTNKKRDKELPFKVNVSFNKLITYWEEWSRSEDKYKAQFAKSVLEKLDKIPALRKPLEDVSLLSKHKNEISLLVSPLFPKALSENEIKALSIPFSHFFFNPSSRFRKILENAPDNFEFKLRGFSDDQQYISACLFILNMAYGANINIQRPYITEIENVETNELRYYRLFFNADFSEFKLNNKNFVLSNDDIKTLLNNYDDITLWKKLIPPETFSFYGFGLITIFDVTSDEILSMLKSDLLNQNALSSPKIVEKIGDNLGKLLAIKDLKFGFVFIDKEGERVRMLDNGESSSLMMNNELNIGMDALFCSRSKHELLSTQNPMTIGSVKEYFGNGVDDLLNNLLSKEINSYMVVPIHQNNKLIGLLELGAKKNCVINSIMMDKLNDIIPLFRLAIERSAEEYQTKLEVVIQEKFTAIHPTVSWRFFEAAENYLINKQKTASDEVEDIVFKNVYPLFGQSDIKGSSTARNRAIEQDLSLQLTAAQKVLDTASKQNAMPVFKEMEFRIENCIQLLKSGLKAGDETNVLTFLKNEVEPVFEHLKEISDHLKKDVEYYYKLLDPELGVVYKMRKEYERSVTLINEKISEYIEKQQAEAQKMYPHYFEKYKTDGVEYNIYIGQSLVKHMPFNKVYLQNLRLWQLLITWGSEQLAHDLKKEMKIPLEVASLILIHSNSLAIKFRADEKQFDVDGAYNVRYEIIKKRIDKAYIKGTQERLTQPGKIAIVYSQQKDALEYKRYLEYLASQSKIESEIEYLELEELQGASGLKALRVSIIFQENNNQEMEEAELKKLLKNV